MVSLGLEARRTEDCRSETLQVSPHYPRAPCDFCTGRGMEPWAGFFKVTRGG